MEASIAASDSYIRLVEYMNVHDDNKETVMAGLASASDMIKVILEGGLCLNGCWLEPVHDQPVRAEVEGIRTDLRKMKTEAEMIIKRGGISGIDSNTYYKFDTLFHGFVKKNVKAEKVVRYRLMQSEHLSKKIFYSILAIWGAVTTIMVFGLLIFESRRTHAENNLRKSLGEKELLLKEIHHRVKNNMQIMSSLLNIQSKYADDDGVHEFLEDYQNRIRSLALVHEKIYTSDDLSSIDFRDYVYSLANILVQTSVKSHNIEINIDIENAKINMDTAIPCGMIINELVSNSLKHAFPNNREGIITIALKKGGDEFILTVGDNGIGIGDGTDISKFKTMGFVLVYDLAEKQMKGSVELDTTRGTSFTIRFREILHKKRV